MTVAAQACTAGLADSGSVVAYAHFRRMSLFMCSRPAAARSMPFSDGWCEILYTVWVRENATWPNGYGQATGLYNQAYLSRMMWRVTSKEIIS